MKITKKDLLYLDLKFKVLVSLMHWFLYQVKVSIVAIKCLIFSFDSEERGTGLLERITTDHRSLLQLQLYEVSDRDSGKCRL